MQLRLVDDQASQLDRAVQRLRELVLEGAFAVDQKLPETRVAEALGVSRTPARLAMAALETEGLILRLPRRGFRVRSFTLDEVAQAIEIRGELEAIAARLLAERGMATPDLALFERHLEHAERLLQGDFTIEVRTAWCQMNLDFHAALFGAAGVAVLSAANAQVTRVPLSTPKAIIFNIADPDLTRQQLRAAHDDHARIVEAIAARRSTRAAALVREHAYRSSENKRRNFKDLASQALVLDSPGAALIRSEENAVRRSLKAARS